MSISHGIAKHKPTSIAHPFTEKRDQGCGPQPTRPLLTLCTKATEKLVLHPKMSRQCFLQETCLAARYPLARNQYISNSPGVSSRIRAGANTVATCIHTEMNCLKNLAYIAGVPRSGLLHAQKTPKVQEFGTLLCRNLERFQFHNALWMISANASCLGSPPYGLSSSQKPRQSSNFIS